MYVYIIKMMIGQLCVCRNRNFQVDCTVTITSEEYGYIRS